MLATELRHDYAKEVSRRDDMSWDYTSGYNVLRMPANAEEVTRSLYCTSLTVMTPEHVVGQSRQRLAWD